MKFWTKIIVLAIDPSKSKSTTIWTFQSNWHQRWTLGGFLFILYKINSSISNMNSKKIQSGGHSDTWHYKVILLLEYNRVIKKYIKGIFRIQKQNFQFEKFLESFFMFSVWSFSAWIKQTSSIKNQQTYICNASNLSWDSKFISRN